MAIVNDPNLQATLEQYRIKNPLGLNDSPSRVSNQYNIFGRDYYCGSDVFICFNNLPMEEIFELKYSLNQQTQAIFGYGSFTWDAVAYGVRYVEGSFRINFKETFYLRSVLEKLQRGTVLDLAVDQNSYSQNLANSDLTIDQLMYQLRNASQEDIKKTANAYEKKLWGTTDKIDKREETAWANVYGGYDYLNDSGDWTSQYNSLLKYGFDIVVAFGDKIYEMNQAPNNNGTAKVLNDVHITGYRTIYEPTGQAISEEYTFIARDMDDSLSMSGTLSKA
jgi:hypothetical protein